MTENTLPRIMTVKEVSEYLKISVQAAYNLTDRNDFPVTRINGRKVVMENKLLSWLEEHTN